MRTRFDDRQRLARRYLFGIRKADYRIDAYLDEILMQEKRLEIPAFAGGEHVSGGTVSADRIPTGIATLHEMIGDMQVAITIYAEQRKLAYEALERLENHDEYEVLHRRYVRNEGFGAISASMGKSERTVYHIHERALTNFYWNLPAEVRIKGEMRENM